MNELAADGVPVAVTCRVLKLVRQDCYEWLAQPVTAREYEEAYRANALFDAHRDDPEFDYRYLADEARDAGEAMADRTRVADQLRAGLVERTREKVSRGTLNALGEGMLSPANITKGECIRSAAPKVVCRLELGCRPFEDHLD